MPIIYFQILEEYDWLLNLAFHGMQINRGIYMRTQTVYSEPSEQETQPPSIPSLWSRLKGRQKNFISGKNGRLQECCDQRLLAWAHCSLGILLDWFEENL